MTKSSKVEFWCNSVSYIVHFHAPSHGHVWEGVSLTRIYITIGLHVHACTIGNIYFEQV